ncbi:MAG: bifunctional homocysteine S-methyltransferase/methylenetetrahydrofolate reductase, partial [Lachnospiraceae bacterium]|nr:bifunctional homocysteine S-methyltransferase/methylenetetrahydrofolate reductase [Lachnospiraceae bacterium]
AFIDSLNQEVFAGDQFGIFGALNVNARNFTVELGRAREKMSQGCIGFLTQPVLTEEAMENLRLARRKLPDAYLLAGLIPVISERNGRFMDQEINGISVPEDMIQSYHGLDRAEGEILGQKYVKSIYARIQNLVDGVYLMTPFHRYQLMTRIVKDLRD